MDYRKIMGAIQYFRKKYHDTLEELSRVEEELKRTLEREKKLIEVIRYVQLCDAYPDLSSFKYKDAYRLIRPKIDDIIKEIDSYKDVK